MAALLSIILGAIPILLFLLYQCSASSRRRRSDFGPEGITVLHKPPKPQFEIVAVHGLGSHPDRTWRSRLVKGRKDAACQIETHLLRDLLPKDFADAHIMSFAYHSKWLIDAPATTTQNIGTELLRKLEQNSKGLPIIFIGHSFGGIVIKEALCGAAEDSDVRRNTLGIIFLGTPHQGSSMSFMATSVAFLTRFLGSSTELISALGANRASLTDLEERFRSWLNNREQQLEPVRLVAVRETKPAYLFGFWSLGLVSTKATPW
ncbi:hypothetical protein NXS19_000082 [Fusarium pseudograminearum]|nr:hypothetical protein NXS19_000082 [Fusarium pseudograminearum]